MPYKYYLILGPLVLAAIMYAALNGREPSLSARFLASGRPAYDSVKGLVDQPMRKTDPEFRRITMSVLTAQNAASSKD